jgi:hypothetical protein
MSESELKTSNEVVVVNADEYEQAREAFADRFNHPPLTDAEDNWTHGYAWSLAQRRNTHETRELRTWVDPDDPDEILTDFLNEYDQGNKHMYEFDKPTALRMLRAALRRVDSKETGGLPRCQCGLYPFGGNVGPSARIEDLHGVHYWDKPCQIGQQKAGGSGPTL